MLIVDDNRDSADTMGMLQQMQGHEVRVAYDGQQGLSVAGEFTPDVILLDIGLPRMDGYEVARRLRQLPSLKDAFIVAMTGYGSESDRARSLDAGFNEHLVKPTDLEQIRKILEGRVLEKCAK